jgi:alpha-galactosidase
MTSLQNQLIELGVEATLASLAGEPRSGLDVSIGATSESGETIVSRDGNLVHVAIGHGEVATVNLEFTTGLPLFRQWIEVSSPEDLTIHRVEPARIGALDFTQVHTISGVQQQGGWRAADGPYRSFRLEHAQLDAAFRTESGLRSTWYESPWVALTGSDIDAGGVLMLLEYGGRWELNIADGVAAFAPVGIEPELQTGETWSSPSVWIGRFYGDLDAAAALTHRFMRENVLPATPDDFPWVQYNTWFSYYCNLDEQALLAEADIAAELGIEVFYVDAGWWVGNPRRKDRFSSGLGNWTENREKFPHGLAWFADQIRAKGLHFGIWVEPERVDMRTVHSGTWKSDWIASDNGRYIRCEWPSDTDTAWLCFGHPETQQWATTWISELVGSLGVRWLKWDSNYWGVCTNPDHGHGTGDGEAAQLEGVYSVMDALRERFPDLIIENCAGGATRMDYAIARHTHCAWINDASEPHYRTRFHTAGATYLYPPETLNSWVTESEHENVNGQQLPADVWRAIIRSRMIGAIGFSNQLVTWTDETRSIAREEIAFYKEHVRSMLKTSTVHHLLPQPEIPSGELLTPDVWESYQLTSATRDRAIIFGFRNVCPIDDVEVKPAGLDQSARYAVYVDGAHATTSTGAELVAQGIRLTTCLVSSTVVTIQREDV